MRNQQAGATAIELAGAVIIAFVLIVSILGATGNGCACPSSKTADTEDDARTFARNTGDEITGVSCVDRDTDGDGYVSCTVFRRGKDPLAIECARGWTMNRGCKLAKWKVNGGSQ